jgi:hypothetical protein
MEPIIATRDSAVLAPHPRMSWGAVFAGWAVAVGFASLMYVAGLALGFSAFDPADGAAAAKGFSIATGVWMVLTWIVALFLGGMFASWFDGNNDATIGAMHGVTVWGLSIVFSGLLVAVGATQVAQGGTALLLGHVTSPAARAPATAQTPLNALRSALQAKLALATRQGAAPAMSGMPDAAPARNAMLDRQAMSAASTAVIAGHPQTAKDILTVNSTLSPTQIDAAVADASAQVQQYEIQAKATAERVAHYTALTLWVAFASSLLGMLAALLGGWLGSDRVQRVYHLRTYAPLAPRGTP